MQRFLIWIRRGRNRFFCRLQSGWRQREMNYSYLLMRVKSRNKMTVWHIRDMQIAQNQRLVIWLSILSYIISVRSIIIE